MVIFSSEFNKSFNKLSKKLQDKVEERLWAFALDEFDESLHNHKLHGEYMGFRSIRVTGDLRIIYKKLGEEKFELHLLGTHSQLY